MKEDRHFGNRLREARLGAGLSQSDLEDISGGIIVQRTPIRTTVPTDTTQGWADSPDTLEWSNPPDIKN